MLSAINNQTSINNSNLAFKGNLKGKIAQKILEKIPPAKLIENSPLSSKGRDYSSIRSLKSVLENMRAWARISPFNR